MEDGGNRSGQAIVGTRAGHAGVPCRCGGVVAEGELRFAGVEVPACNPEFSVAIPLEPIPGQNVEDAVGAVAHIGRITAALNFESVDVLGVNLRADVGGDLCVGNRNAVEEPTGLVAAVHVQHVVRHVSAGHVVGDHLHAERTAGARSFVDVGAGDKSGGSDGVRGDCCAVEALNDDRFSRGADRQRDVGHWIGSGRHGERLGKGSEALGGNLQAINSNGGFRQCEFSVAVRLGVEGEFGIRSLEHDLRSNDGAVLGIVDDAANRCENGGSGWE